MRIHVRDIGSAARGADFTRYRPPFGRLYDPELVQPAPQDLDADALRAYVESHPQAIVMLRHSTLRMVGSLATRPDPSASGGILGANFKLPWEHDLYLAATHDPAFYRLGAINQRFLMGFELGRASQLKFTDESKELGRFALSIAAQRSIAVQSAFGQDSAEIPVYVHSLDRGHGVLFKRQIGGEFVVPPDPEHSGSLRWSGLSMCPCSRISASSWASTSKAPSGA